MTDLRKISHTCHLPICTVVVPKRLFMCKEHWYMVPKILRDGVWANYNPGQENGKVPVTDRYLAITDLAIRAVIQKLKKVKP